MKKYLFIIAAAAILTSCAEVTSPQSPAQQTPAAKPQPSTQAPTSWISWAKWIEKRRHTADEQGHGPDIGSDEWAGSVDRQLGISEGGHGPDLKSPEWRRAVERKLGLHL